MATASADPDKLDRAAAAVPPDVKDVLVQAVVRGDLASGIARFASMRQNPKRLNLGAEGLVGAVTTAKTTGDELDTRLVRIAAEFRRAGGHRAGVPWGWQGPVAPGTPAAGGGKPPTTMYMDDAALQAGMGRWGQNQGLEWRQREDGNVEMRGPDGNWYLVVGSPPPGAPVLGRSQRTVDFTNMKAGAIKSAAVTTGLGGYSTDPPQHAPRAAYDQMPLDENGMPAVSPDAGSYSSPVPKPVGGRAGPGDVNQPFPRPVTGDEEKTLPWRKGEQALPWRSSTGPGWWRSPGEAPPGLRWEPLPGTREPLDSRAGRGAAALGLVNAAAEYAKHNSYGNANTFRTQASFYVDPRTGQRVAVANVASITYEKPYVDDDRRYVVVRWGRLATDAQGRPTIVAEPGQAGFAGGGTYKAPIEEPK